jgi:hypothetical protein
MVEKACRFPEGDNDTILQWVGIELSRRMWPPLTDAEHTRANDMLAKLRKSVGSAMRVFGVSWREDEVRLLVGGEIRIKKGMTELEEPSPSERLRDYAKGLREVPRSGADVDEPEGARTIEMSDTLARRLANELEQFAAWQEETINGVERLIAGLRKLFDKALGLTLATKDGG